MGVKLGIYWDGTTPGLPEGRLSIAQFGSALQALLKAARNIARRHQAAARGEDYNPEAATRSQLVDIQLSSYVGGSADQEFELVPAPGLSAEDAFAATPVADQILRDLMDAIDAERQGRRRDRFVAEYLRALPRGVTRQRYSLREGGQETKVVEFEEMRLLELEAPPPALRLLRGQVEGVVFGERSGRPEVKFAPFNGKVFVASATRAQVSEAIDVQHAAIGLFLMTEVPRLLWIRREGSDLPVLPEKQRTAHFLSHWADVLKELAK